MPPDVDTNRESVQDRLSCFEYIGTENTVAELIKTATGASIEQPKTINSSQYYFDTGIFQEDELLTFLHTHNQKDLYLYESVTATFKAHALHAAKMR